MCITINILRIPPQWRESLYGRCEICVRYSTKPSGPRQWKTLRTRESHQESNFGPEEINLLILGPWLALEDQISLRTRIFHEGVGRRGATVGPCDPADTHVAPVYAVAAELSRLTTSRYGTQEFLPPPLRLSRVWKRAGGWNSDRVPAAIAPVPAATLNTLLGRQRRGRIECAERRWQLWRPVSGDHAPTPAPMAAPTAPASIPWPPHPQPQDAEAVQYHPQHRPEKARFEGGHRGEASNPQWMNEGPGGKGKTRRNKKMAVGAFSKAPEAGNTPLPNAPQWDADSRGSALRKGFFSLPPAHTTLLPPLHSAKPSSQQNNRHEMDNHLWTGYWTIETNMFVVAPWDGGPHEGCRNCGFPTLRRDGTQVYLPPPERRSEGDEKRPKITAAAAATQLWPPPLWLASSPPSREGLPEHTNTGKIPAAVEDRNSLFGITATLSGGFTVDLPPLERRAGRRLPAFPPGRNGTQVFLLSPERPSVGDGGSTPPGMRICRARWIHAHIELDLSDYFSVVGSIDNDEQVSTQLTPGVSSLIVSTQLTPGVSSLIVSTQLTPGVSSLRVSTQLTPGVSSLRVSTQLTPGVSSLRLITPVRANFIRSHYLKRGYLDFLSPQRAAGGPLSLRAAMGYSWWLLLFWLPSCSTGRRQWDVGIPATPNATALRGQSKASKTLRKLKIAQVDIPDQTVIRETLADDIKDVDDNADELESTTEPTRRKVVKLSKVDEAAFQEKDATNTSTQHVEADNNLASHPAAGISSVSSGSSVPQKFVYPISKPSANPGETHSSRLSSSWRNFTAADGTQVYQPPPRRRLGAVGRGPPAPGFRGIGGRPPIPWCRKGTQVFLPPQLRRGEPGIVSSRYVSVRCTWRDEVEDLLEFFRHYRDSPETTPDDNKDSGTEKNDNSDIAKGTHAEQEINQMLLWTRDQLADLHELIPHYRDGPSAPEAEKIVLPPTRRNGTQILLPSPKRHGVADWATASSEVAIMFALQAIYLPPRRRRRGTVGRRFRPPGLRRSRRVFASSLRAQGNAGVPAIPIAVRRAGDRRGGAGMVQNEQMSSTSPLGQNELLDGIFTKWKEDVRRLGVESTVEGAVALFAMHQRPHQQQGHKRLFHTVDDIIIQTPDYFGQFSQQGHHTETDLDVQNTSPPTSSRHIVDARSLQRQAELADYGYIVQKADARRLRMQYMANPDARQAAYRFWKRAAWLTARHSTLAKRFSGGRTQHPLNPPLRKPRTSCVGPSTGSMFRGLTPADSDHAVGALAVATGAQVYLPPPRRWHGVGAATIAPRRNRAQVYLPPPELRGQMEELRTPTVLHRCLQGDLVGEWISGVSDDERTQLRTHCNNWIGILERDFMPSISTRLATARAETLEWRQNRMPSNPSLLLVASGSPIGTPFYSAPESGRHQAVDVWELAVIALELLYKFGTLPDRAFVLSDLTRKDDRLPATKRLLLGDKLASIPATRKAPARRGGMKRLRSEDGKLESTTAGGNLAPVMTPVVESRLFDRGRCGSIVAHRTQKALARVQAIGQAVSNFWLLGGQTRTVYPATKTTLVPATHTNIGNAETHAQALEVDSLRRRCNSGLPGKTSFIEIDRPPDQVTGPLTK
ncbi:hypothetical protein FPV67DRAFT_1460892 [Lyophyllum atratum]|nr:hypothetical protein FPV67DRAFT_1460892 [Lyophyllum atratum]